MIGRPVAVPLSIAVLLVGGHTLYQWWDTASFGDHVAAVCLIVTVMFEAIVFGYSFVKWDTDPFTIHMRQRREELARLTRKRNEQLRNAR